MAYGLQDVITLRQFLQDSNADEAHKRVEHHKLESMLGLCELITCRRFALLHYFEEQGVERCGNCDNCLTPPEKWDGTVAAQKALSCVYRSGQRFGVNYIIDVLVGKDDDRIKRNGHDQISTFGVGAEFSGVEWRSIFRQLIALGYLDIDAEAFGALKLTDKCRPLLKGEQQLDLRKYQKEQKVSGGSGKHKSPVRPQDEPLWDALRELRMELATEFGVPPYVIFHDSTLREMIKTRPNSRQQMGLISGVGQQKLDRYGERFLAEIERHYLPDMLVNNLSATVNETLVLFEQGVAIEKIAQQRELTENSIYSHLADAIEVGLLDGRQVTGLESADFDQVVLMIESLVDEDKGRLKPVFDALDEQHSYGILRCVQASM